MTSKVVVTCALTGVLTDPAQHHVPVTPEEMAREARAAFDAGASIVHVHFRQQSPGKGHLPSWEPAVALEIAQAIRESCPGIIFNQSTGVVGPDISGPVACMRAVRPEIAAANAGSLNYLKVRSDGRWAWPPMLFDNPVEKVAAFLQVMDETGALPEFECFDVGIVRSVEMFVRSGLYRGHPDVNFVMGVESGMPADPALLPILIELLPAAGNVAGHGDRPRERVAAAPSHRGTRRQPPHRARRHLLSSGRQQGPRQRRVDRRHRCPCPRCGTRQRFARRSAQTAAPGRVAATGPGKGDVSCASSCRSWPPRSLSCSFTCWPGRFRSRRWHGMRRDSGDMSGRTRATRDSRNSTCIDRAGNRPRTHRVRLRRQALHGRPVGRRAAHVPGRHRP